MTRNEAINYLRSSGMSDEQIKTVAAAFTCTDSIRDSIRDLIKEFDDLIEDITYKLMEVEE